MDTKTAKDALNFIEDSDTMEGFEDISSKTMAVPFLRILQKGSPQVNNKKPEYINGAEAGMFFNTVTKELYGEKVILIILKFVHVYIEWMPDRGGFVDYHDPDNAERLAVDKTFCHWKMENGNELQETYQYFVLVEGHEHEGPMILPMASSNIRVAKELNRMLTTHIMDNGKRAMPYYLMWDFSTEYKENDKGDWYGLNFKFTGYINEETYAITKRERITLPDKKVDYSQLEDKTSDNSEALETKGQGDHNKVPY
jgi:hypothetical protein